MAGDGLVCKAVLALALLNNLLEKKGAACEDQDNGPDLERGLGTGRVGVSWGLVGSCGLAWLAEARRGDEAGGEGASTQRAEAQRQTMERRRHGERVELEENLYDKGGRGKVRLDRR
jgi:hypothetical protein